MAAKCASLLAASLLSIAVCATGQMETAMAQESGTSGPTACRLLEGTYKNSGTQVSGKDRGSTLPPLISRDVLRTWKHGVHTEWVAINILHGDRVKFSLLDSSGTTVAAYEHNGVCTNGELVFERTATGGSEGYRGTTVTQVRLSVVSDGSALRVNVFDRSEGRDFMVIPHSDVAERQFQFESKGADAR